MRVLFQVVFVLLWSWLFIKFPPLLYGLYFLIFFLTIILKRNYWKLEITRQQAEHYAGFNTIITLFLGLFALSEVSHVYLYYEFKEHNQEYFFVEHSGVIEAATYFLLLLVGLINFSNGIGFPEFIAKQEADYERRKHLAENQENN